jgi:hypothetical protein
MADYANKLDDLLHGLAHAASGFQVSGTKSNNVDVLGHDLTKLLQQMNLTTSTELHLQYDKTLTQINEAKSIALILQSLIRFTVQHNYKKLRRVSLITTSVSDELKLVLTLDDVAFNEEIIQHLNLSESLDYTMVLLNPGLAYLFSAMKGLSVLRGSLDCESDTPDSITFNISSPLHRE